MCANSSLIEIHLQYSDAIHLEGGGAVWRTLYQNKWQVYCAVQYETSQIEDMNPVVGFVRPLPQQGELKFVWIFVQFIVWLHIFTYK